MERDGFFSFGGREQANWIGPWRRQTFGAWLGDTGLVRPLRCPTDAPCGHLPLRLSALIRMSTEPIPATVVSGFLGSGKTTLLNRLLSASHGRRIAVIVNEFGEVGIDGSLVAGGERFVELDNGCLCCVLNADLVELLGELGRRDDIDQLVVETTGIADPLPVGWAFSRPQLEGRFRLDCLVTVADCLNLERAVEGSREGRYQLERADLLLLAKGDLVDAERRAEVDARLAALNATAPRFAADDPAALTLLLETELDGAFAGVAAAAPHHHHEHGAGHTTHEFESVAVEVGERAADRDELEDLLEQLPPTVYRSKGVVRVAGEAEWMVFHSVASRLEIDWMADHDGPGALVFIGKGLDRAGLERAVAALFGKVARVEPGG